ncbi:MBL fold metallo-hydrolase [Salipaludibacillus aurantiacus]|uniref:Glyoxylase, beta-lactamase superfamily II n=1 Tax=Salipaludibacillus aurantiacus TaxID=1601833 RepID=A0A1H9V0P7_9BACI|nr:MBL fold metallo-hydrolase [Salipaludibacillus aurantiacus]SES15242.1 Glyoxylase, beta-lactamase superfamily II [Salipaludibacillus aurantiacus]
MSLKPMTAKELGKMVINREEIFILDVRNTDAFDDWKVEGEGVEIINKPYFDLIDGVDDIVGQLPEDKPLLVVCAKEGSSQFVAEQIVEATGRDTHYLVGGMKTWSEHLEPVKLGDLKDGGELYQFVRLGKGCLSYLVASDGEAAIIDSARTIEPYNEFLAENNLTLKHVIDTHLHADHISGGRKLREKHGASYWLPPKDAEEVTFDFKPLEDGNDIIVGQTKVAIHPIYSPGHTIGSTSMVIDDQYLISGDILFVDSIGRPDLAGKAEDWVADLRNSLYSIYAGLSGDLYVLPAHFGKHEELDAQGRVMEKLSVLFEKNHGLNINDEEEFRKTVTEDLPPQPNAYQEIRQTNMGKINPDADEQTEMEIGPNRCAVSG